MIHVIVGIAAAAAGVAAVIVIGALALVAVANRNRPTIPCGWCDSPPTQDGRPHAPGCPDRLHAA